MQKGLKKIGLGLVAVGLCLVLLLTAAVPVCEAGPGEKERMVKIGIGSIFTGPAASQGGPACAGFLDCVRYLNEQGGINGIKIEVPWYETAFMIPRVVVAYRRLVEQGILMYYSSPLDAAIALLPRAQKDGIPLNFVDALMAGSVTRPQWVLVTLSEWPATFVMTMKWVKENLWTEARPMRVGMIFYDTGAGWSNLDGVKYLDNIGVEFVGYETVPLIGCIDTSTELLRLAAKKADCIFMVSYGSPSVVIVKDAKRLEIQQKGIKLIASANSLDHDVLSIVGKDADGWYADKGTPCYFETEKFPGLKIMIDKAKEYRGYKPKETDGFYAVGWAHAAVAVEAIRLAIEEVGYENLTGHAVRDALFSGRIKDFNMGTLPPITITEDTPWIVNSFWICEIREGDFHPIGRPEALPSLYITPDEFERVLQKS